MTAIRPAVEEYDKRYGVAALLKQAVNKCFEEQSPNPAAFFAHFFAQQVQESTIDSARARRVLCAEGGYAVQVTVVSEGHEVASPTTRALEVPDEHVSGFSSDLLRVLSGTPLIDQGRCDDSLSKLTCHAALKRAASFAVLTGGCCVRREPVFVRVAKLRYHDVPVPEKLALPTPVAWLVRPSARCKVKVAAVGVLLLGSAPAHAKLVGLQKVYSRLGLGIENKFQTAPGLTVGGSYSFSGWDSWEQMMEIFREAIEGSEPTEGVEFRLAVKCAPSRYDLPARKTLDDTPRGVSELVALFQTLADSSVKLGYLEDVFPLTEVAGWQHALLTLHPLGVAVAASVSCPDAQQTLSAHKMCAVGVFDVDETVTDTLSLIASWGGGGGAEGRVLAIPGGYTGGTEAVDVAVGCQAGFFSAGGLRTAEGVALWNRLLALEVELQHRDQLLPTPTGLPPVPFPDPPTIEPPAPEPVGRKASKAKKK